MVRAVIDRLLGANAIRLVRKGNKYLAEGDAGKALCCARDAVASYRKAPGAYVLMAKAMMPGEDYLSILDHLHQSIQPKSYVEIGVDKGRSMKLINNETSAVGIDPAHQIQPGNETSARIFTMFSDDFFKSHNLLKELGCDRVDMTFIDGSHIFEQTLRDIINLEKYSDSKTVMILHDCIPVGSIVAERKRVTDFWCGDVWKVVDCLKKYRTDLKIRIVAAPPSGLVIITGLDHQSTILNDKYGSIVNEYVPMQLDYEILPESALENYIPSQWNIVAEQLGFGITPP